MRVVLVALMIFASIANPLATASVARAEGTCLSRGELRQAIRSGRAIRPGRIRRTLGGKVLRLKLCETASGLVWQVTTLDRSGHVVGHVIDARSGRVIR